MFRTDPTREVHPFPFPVPEARFWDAVELTSRSCVLLLACDDGSEEGWHRTLLVSPESMEALLDAPELHIRQASLIIPDDLASSECWRFGSIYEVWACRARYGQHSVKGWLFVLDGGSVVDTFGPGAGPIEREALVYRMATGCRNIEDHQEGRACGV